MNQRNLIGLALAVSISALSLPFSVQAQQTTSIGKLQPPDNTTTIQGTIESVVGNNFTLSDGTGEVIVDAGPRWWKEVNVSPGEKVTVVGKMGKGEFDAYSITKADGTKIEIRPATDGPPPWAGKPKR